MKWMRTLVGSLSFTTAMFVFQACYGTAQDFGNDFLLEGKVTDKNTGLPLSDIKVTVGDEWQYAITDSLGNFSLYTIRTDSLKVVCSNRNLNSGNQYVVLDTAVLAGDADRLFVSFQMVEKQ